jgi:hypothetical protein
MAKHTGGCPPTGPVVCDDCGQPIESATVKVHDREILLLEQMYKAAMGICATSWILLAVFVMVKIGIRATLADLIVMLFTTIVAVPWTHQRWLDARNIAKADAEYAERRVNDQYVTQDGGSQPTAQRPQFTPGGADAWAENEPDRDE